MIKRILIGCFSSQFTGFIRSIKLFCLPMEVESRFFGDVVAKT